MFESWTNHVYGLCTAVYTGRKTAVYMVHGHVRIVYTTTQCIPGIAKVDSRNLLEGYYSDPITHSIEIDLFTYSVALTFWVTM